MLKKAAKVLLAIIVPGTISVLSWLNVYPFVARELSMGQNIPVWFIAAVNLFAPFLIFTGIAAFDRYLHIKEGHKLTLGEAFFKICLAATPLALNAIVLLTWVISVDRSYLGWWPFLFFEKLLRLYESAIQSDLLGNLGYLATEGFGLAWAAFFLLYARLSRITRRRLVLAIVFIPIFVTVAFTAEIFLIIDWID